MLRRSRHILPLTLAALALGALVAGTPARASATPEDPGTATTVLEPGWNMVAWLGPEASATDLFEAVPALRRAWAWDAEHQRYLSRTRTSVPLHGLRTLEPGMGLWLDLGGNAPFDWRQDVAPGGVLVPLRAGQNLVGWAGADGMEPEEALARLGASLVSASRWDTASRRYDRYRPGAVGSANTLDQLRRGDALWVELAADARWWQSGAVGVDYVFPASVPAERQASIRDDMASAVTFFAERYALRPPEFTVTVDLGLEPFAAARAREILISRRALNDALLGVTLAHEYFHVLQWRLGEYSPDVIDPSPRWMTEGSATYAGGLYREQRWGVTPEALRLARLRHSLTVEEELDDLTLSRLFYAGEGPAYSLAALALEWLSGYAAADSPETFAPTAPGWSDGLPDRARYIAYYDRLAAADDWGAALKATFGLSPDEFYDSFAAYRAALVASRFPHLADDEDEPLLVLLGEVAAETETSVRAAFASVQAFFTERLGAGPVDYTVYAAGGSDSVTDAHVRAFGVTPDDGFCRRTSSGIVALVVIDLGCPSEAPYELDHYHHALARDRLAPWSSLAPTEDGLDRRGPWWLLQAIRGYAEQAFDATRGGSTLEEVRTEQASLARSVTTALASLESVGDASAAGFQGARALAFLAGVRLAEHAGETALFEYYRQLPSSESWRAAFEAAFGMSAADFTEAFEAYRAGAAPPESGGSASSAGP